MNQVLGKMNQVLGSRCYPLWFEIILFFSLGVVMGLVLIKLFNLKQQKDKKK